MKVFQQQDNEALAATADASSRQRAHHLFHPLLEDPIQRMVMVMNPDTYVRPHRHVDPARWELFVVIRGRVVALCFDDQGRIEERHELAAGGANSVAEIEPGRWHALTALDTHTTVFECKPGPYIAVEDKDFAAWAPREGENTCAAFIRWYQTSHTGDLPPGS